MTKLLRIALFNAKNQSKSFIVSYRQLL